MDLFYFCRISSGRWQRQLNSCFRGHMVAFDLGEFHRVDGRGNWIPASKVIWLPLILASFTGSTAEATEFLLPRSHGCLWPNWASSGRWQRQQKQEKSRELLPPGKQVRWVPDNSYQRQDGFLIIYIKELNCLHKSPQKNKKCCKNNTFLTWFMA